MNAPVVKRNSGRFIATKFTATSAATVETNSNVIVATLTTRRGSKTRRVVDGLGEPLMSTTELFVVWLDGTVLQHTYQTEALPNDVYGIAADPMVVEFRVRRNG